MLKERLNYYFRQRLTTAELELLQRTLSLTLDQFASDIAEPGIIGLQSPLPTATPTREVRIPQLIAYSPSFRLMIVGSTQSVDLNMQGDVNISRGGSATSAVEDLNITNSALPEIVDGEELWVSVGLMPVWSGYDSKVDGYGDQVNAAEQASYKYRIVHGTKAASGTALRPSSNLFPDGVILGDILLAGSGSTASSGTIFTNRTERFRIKNAILLASGQTTNTPRSIFKGFSIPGTAFDSGSNSVGLIRFSNTRYKRVALVGVRAYAAPAFQIDPTGQTTIQLSTQEDWSSPNVSLYIAVDGNEGYTSTYIEFDASSEAIRARITEGGLHENIQVECEFLVVE